eukprot:scaffold37146_cov67-Phaeocystis_antarctica.AAC.5
MSWLESLEDDEGGQLEEHTSWAELGMKEGPALSWSATATKVVTVGIGVLRNRKQSRSLAVQRYIERQELRS